MAIFACSKEMTKYHADEVVLSRADQKEMRERRDNGRKRLKSGLEKDGYKLPTEQESQGSYAMRTMVEDEQCDYDIDDGQYFEKSDLADAEGNFLAPKAARERICKALRHDERVYPAKVLDNCVRQAYADGYHIDMPVYRIVRTKDAQGEEVVSYELASADDWVFSDARAVTRWFAARVTELKEGEADPSQLRRVVRLTKKLARSRIGWKKKTASGITLTRLAVDEFVPKDGDDEALYETWKKISDRVGTSTEVEHPIKGKLAEKGDAKVAFFAECLAMALEDLKVLEDPECDQKKALSAWDKAFGTSFFSEQAATETSKAAAIFVTSTEKAKRDDGDRRFG
jgi:hypothetical protein